MANLAAKDGCNEGYREQAERGRECILEDSGVKSAHTNRYFETYTGIRVQCGGRQFAIQIEGTRKAMRATKETSMNSKK